MRHRFTYVLLGLVAFTMLAGTATVAARSGKSTASYNVGIVYSRTGLLAAYGAEYIEGLNTVRRAQGFLRVVNIIPGPIGVFRRTALMRAGGYDTDTYAEDADITLKLLTAGWHIAYEEHAIAYTEAPERYLELMRVDKKAQGGDIRFVLLDGEGHATVRSAPQALVVDVLAALTSA